MSATPITDRLTCIDTAIELSMAETRVVDVYPESCIVAIDHALRWGGQPDCAMDTYVEPDESDGHGTTMVWCWRIIHADNMLWGVTIHRDPA